MMESVRDIPSIAGWTPPICYDINLDAMRVVTQADVDKWIRMEQTYGKMVTFLRQEHEQLLRDIQGPQA